MFELSDKTISTLRVSKGLQNTEKIHSESLQIFCKSIMIIKRMKQKSCSTTNNGNVKQQDKDYNLKLLQFMLNYIEKI